MKKYTKASQQNTVRKELQKPDAVVVRFFRIGCPACEGSQGDWDDFCKKETKYKTIEIEEKAIPSEILRSIEGFPTYAKHDENGNHHITGAQKELHKALRLMD